MRAFEDWRQSYNTSSYQDQLAFYDWVWENYPDQVHFDLEAAARFFELVGPASVAEVGGWRGELATQILARHPELTGWENLEICRGAVAASVCKDPRYRANVPDRWVWELPPDQTSTVLVLSHVIEHMTAAQASLLIARYPSVRWIFIQSPLDNEAPDWEFYPGSHILEVGWGGLVDILAGHGFGEIPELRTDEVRCFAQ